MIVSMNVSHFVKMCQVLTILHQLICRGVTNFGTRCSLAIQHHTGVVISIYCFCMFILRSHFRYSFRFLVCSIDLRLWYAVNLHNLKFAFSAMMLLVGWQEGHLAWKKLEWWGTGVVICLRSGQICIWPSRFHCHLLQ